jgi:uncharacterized protein (DUF488 family)
MKQPPPGNEVTVYTVGHSNHPAEKLLELLKCSNIEMVVDVRSSPYSRYATHFNKEILEGLLRAQGTKYDFYGDVIGGKPEEREFYDEEGYVLYDRLSQSPGFRHGIRELIKEIQRYRVAILCSEEDPTNCHRRMLIGRVLHGEGVKVLHIRGDGRIQTEEQVAQEEEFQRTKGQASLFDMQESKEWKSTQSVLQKNPQKSSSSLSGEQESSR